MHVLIGALIVIATFLTAFQYISAEFSGFFNLYSAILLGGVPIGLMILTYRFGVIGSAFKGLGRALIGNPAAERDRLVEHLLGFARAIRSERPAEASAIIEREPDPMFKHLGRQVLQQTHAEEVELDALVIGRRELSTFQNGERVFGSLGDFAPAMGMIGTVIGLIQLLANMRDFEKLGPGMAIALLTTFYGLLLAHLLYLPLARLIGQRRLQRAENLNLVVDAMLKIARRRPLHELQQLLSEGRQAALTPVEPSRRSA
ncbi:motility protein A [Lujinxingia vulgaris]|nr:MotA/TolQ/ExbB proton channel family protein [Lujinxingia vulgaris]